MYNTNQPINPDMPAFGTVYNGVVCLPVSDLAGDATARVRCFASTLLRPV